MNIDPNLAYKRQLEYEQYISDQYEKTINLSDQTVTENPNETIKLFADQLYAKDSRYLSTDRCGMLLDENTTAEDLFCIGLELILYGYGKFSKTELFSIDSTSDDVIYQIRPYLRSVGIVLNIEEDFSYDSTNINSYRDRSDYYCQIGTPPPPFIDLATDPWDILSYRITLNRKFAVTDTTTLADFKAYFVSKTKQIFTISFSLDLS